MQNKGMFLGIYCSCVGGCLHSECCVVSIIKNGFSAVQVSLSYISFLFYTIMCTFSCDNSPNIEASKGLSIHEKHLVSSLSNLESSTYN